ncbi:MAG: SPASM domain-containing protein [Thiotrichaceae bacterium]
MYVYVVSTAIEADPPLYINTGNLYEAPLNHLWNSEMAQQVRTGLLGLDKPHPICARIALI